MSKLFKSSQDSMESFGVQIASLQLIETSGRVHLAFCQAYDVFKTRGPSWNRYWDVSIPKELLSIISKLLDKGKMSPFVSKPFYFEAVKGFAMDGVLIQWNGGALESLLAIKSLLQNQFLNLATKTLKRGFPYLMDGFEFFFSIRSRLYR
ncbi:unnamed protein product [Lepeophtheirus salmonis]|uniref:(salmon louse) hypothetical protein n=1 Tax=Lepeophtheirus salmonis TaxID=72036 RepID=A0A7R8H2M4_LEPSM|nr:unnamed protein product [Lepeophtheirus salmonis]CAF2830494.1 unnamed protein product [Lepeophtheirus salmonis]